MPQPTVVLFPVVYSLCPTIHHCQWRKSSNRMFLWHGKAQPGLSVCLCQRSNVLYVCVCETFTERAGYVTEDHYVFLGLPRKPVIQGLEQA